MAARRETADPAPSQTPVGADSISARFAAAQGSAGGINPSPTNHGRPAANRGKRGLAVISDLCSGRCSHCARRRVSEANRATGPALRPEIVPQTPRRRKVPQEGHGPPLQTMANTRPNGKGTRPRTAVGRDALIPPHPAAAGTPAGGINHSPTNHEGPAAKRASRGPAVILGLCRGRCLHCARRRVSEANRATGPALRPEIVPRGLWRRKVPREGHGPPLQTMANARPNGKGTRPRAAVGRDALIPPHPAAAQGSDF